MWRVVTGICLALTFVASGASAQQPCTADAARVVAEVYRHTLERSPDAGAQTWQRQIANEQLTVREVVRRVAKSNEYMQRFGRTEAGEGQPYERAVARLYRHVLARQPDGNGLEQWTRVAQQRGLGAVVDGFVDSEEYIRNFGDWAVPGSGGVRFCDSGPRNSQNDTSDWTPRFRGMDRNNDGVIARSEWNGNTIAFNNQDWNNDGVLSGEEVRQGGQRQQAGRRGGLRRADYDFDGLDTNNNNRIERREWQARLDQFQALDTNNDNFLSRAELQGDEIGIGTAGRSIAVGADRSWVDTGIDLRAGETVSISADGSIRIARDGGPMPAAGGAAGRTDGAPMPNSPVGGLIARVGTSAPLFIGQNRTLRAPRAGRLYLGINDSYFEDNTGQFNVTVDVR